MNISLLILCLLTSCASINEQTIVQTLSAAKQKQKIGFLQKKLEIAEKEQQKAQTEVEKLVSEIDQAKLALIRKQIDSYQADKGKGMPLFEEEREALYRLIQEGPSQAAFEAQAELDRILRIITELSDEEENV